MPVIVEELAIASGKTINHSSHTQGGATLATHAGNSAAYAAINSNPWDYVVLQAQSQEPSFSDNQVNTQTIPYAIQIADSVYANKFCSEVTMFMTWGRENGDPQWGPISTYEGMQNRLRNAYMRMADSIEGSVSPVGMAWKYTRENYPSIDLYQPDESHPSYAGSYLAACTFYATFYRESPIGNLYIGGLDPTTATNLQTAAHIAVMDSLEQWNIRPIEEHTQASFDQTSNALTVDFTNTSTKAQNYYWDFGDGNNSTDEHPTHTYATTGSYWVTLIAESPCDTDTAYVNLLFDNIGFNEIEMKHLFWHKNESNQIIISGFNESGRIDVVDMYGRVIYNSEVNEESHLIPEGVLGSGIYLVNYYANDNIKSIRILNDI
jgi:hypothetical protein